MAGRMGAFLVGFPEAEARIQEIDGLVDSWPST